ncbi:sulfatase [Mameliella sediminis]|uniref:sulfatase n=1 Tax=Mameliella sediminis TaxID=2836866 RepID=UPI001C45FC18|nr:sulfatase [Mameliella sediminis]MBV7396448.1 sulfatase [Mameliella sediminis]
MKTIFVLFDSLNRHMLSPYGGTRIPTPNFDRLAARSATFDKHYVGSMPCMPARRDLLTGRLSFLHRSWGPLEPFDNAFPEILAREKGVYSHLVTDHFHYFEDGGATYHNRYDSFDFVRGQEGDRWKAMVQPHWDRLREKYHDAQFSAQRRDYKSQNMINREFIRAEEDFPSVQVFDAGMRFIDANKDADNWVLQIETFDPHEPFHAPERFKTPFDTGWTGGIRDWPRYGRVDELPEECEELRANYYATVALCDDLLGRLLDQMDREEMWDDTILIVTTDHGFLLGEHDFWAKNRMNIYEEIAHIPLFIHDPRRPAADGARVDALTQTSDIAPTMLDIYGAEVPSEVTAQSLLPLLDGGTSSYDAVLFGYFGGAVNITDGRHSYHRYPPDLQTQDIYQYTLMPTNINELFPVAELAGAELSGPFAFTKGAPLLKVPVRPGSAMSRNYGPDCFIEDDTRLYDLIADPGQEAPLDAPEIETRLAAQMARMMTDLGAPDEAFARLGLDADGIVAS